MGVRDGLDASWTRRVSDWKDMLPVDFRQDYFRESSKRSNEIAEWQCRRQRTGDICPCCGMEVEKLYQHKRVCVRWPK